jgi:large subunit ribosomal protein L10
MALSKNKKKEVLDKVSDIAKKNSSMVFINFHGLGVAETTEIRRQLRTAGVNYTVAKKTLAAKALGERGFGGQAPELAGELAIVYAGKGADQSDITAPAREIRTFEKKFEGKIAILGGVFESKYVSKEEMSAIAGIPSKQALYGMFVNLVNSPIQRFVIALDQVAKTKTA